MRITYGFDDRGARRATAELRRQIGKDARAAGREVAKDRCLPAARAKAPSVYAHLIRPHATTKGVGVKLAGARGGATAREIAGYLEFGGTLRAKHRPYLTFRVGGRWVRVQHVSIPRSKQGHYIGVAMANPALVAAVHRDLERAYSLILDRHLSRSGAVVG